MNIINLALKEMKRDFRDLRTLIFLLAFPIVLMLILGTALSSDFNTTTEVVDIPVLYKDSANQSVSQAFQTFTEGLSDSGVHFKKATETMDGKKAVKENKYGAYIEVTNSQIKMYESNKNSIEGSVIEGMLSAFVDKYNMISTVAKVSPNALSKVTPNSGEANFIKETGLHSLKKPGAMDYYAITMTTMIALFGAMSASYLIRGERIIGTATRLVVAPISKAEIFIGKIFGGVLTSVLCTLIVVLFSKYVFKANWGEHLGIVFFVLITEIVLAISFGLGMSYMTKTSGASQAIIMVVIQLAAFFGGAYFQVEDGGGLMNNVMQLSPLHWANHAITQVIYSDNMTPAIHAAFLNLGISVVFLLIAIISMGRREGL
ncbi:ABC-2 type transport system permease protein [Pullulanibacillus pueri]|uniref:ABC transporter permease n=1 Tax=Pullulanibacillus pueri TaxID=1437324 RepID=A0A8J2ZU40_9BACL|nr:ABC transporter permease [Pullulanibacillus pueri]MBM7680807.1 ABC-2 type transport system permease protein [Pullulanibacillus pueri]GGH78411.1 ABC transporter permease [Pullulanibacillus pueri]